jgi:peptidoglycan/LPS O-acetylase OafA/YrhL
MTISSAKASSKPFLTHLAGLRGFAILCVILFHLNGDYTHITPPAAIELLQAVKQDFMGLLK